jgi:hypothetical protein
MIFAEIWMLRNWISESFTRAVQKSQCISGLLALVFGLWTWFQATLAESLGIKLNLGNQ